MAIVVPIPSSITATNANTAAAGLSFASFFFLFLVNLGTPIIKAIYIASYESTIGKITTRVIFGVYGACVESSGLTGGYICASSAGTAYSASTGGTRFLLSMHSIGVITSFMLFSAGIYTRSHQIVYKKATWAVALFSSFVIMLAMAGQIDNFLKLKRLFTLFGSINDTVSLGAGGFILVFIAFITSLLAAYAFYVGEQRGEGDTTNGSNYNNYNGNMSTGMTNQQPQYPQSYSTPQASQPYSNPQSYPNNQPYPNNQSYPPQPYSNPQPHPNNQY